MSPLAPADGPTVRPPLVVGPLGLDDRSSSRRRVVDGALSCIARAGLAKTTVDDVAREAGVSRATLYRLFPGGKDAVLHAVVQAEAARLFCELGVVLDRAENLEALFVDGIVEAARWLGGHGVLERLVRHEPTTVLPYLAFSGMGRLLEVASVFAAPFLGRWLEPEQAVRAGEWAARIVLSYLVCPDATADLTDRSAVAHLVGTFVVPGILAVRCDAENRTGAR